MLRLKALVCIATVVGVVISLQAAPSVRQARMEKIAEVIPGDLRVKPLLIAADTCIVRHDDSITWRIDGWVYGNELYKSYLDPALTCPNPYPYTVVEINMPMAFDGATIIEVSVDIEDVAYQGANCPIPDTLIAISATYQLQVPGAGLYNIWIPLDEPVDVDGPFFAGFFIANQLDQSVNPAVVTDNDASALCASYNIWDDSIGFVDLLNNEFWNFPGRLVLYASGVPGGGNIEPAPAITIISPEDNPTLMGAAEIWAHETSGSNILDYVKFEYSNGGPYVEFGRDYDGYSPLRNDQSSVLAGDGFSYYWSFAARPEGFYTIRATAYDTLGRTATDEVNVYLEPTPPLPMITTPINGADFCPQFTLNTFTQDENLTQVDFYRKQANPSYAAGLTTLSEAPFGNYYSAPVAAALAIKLWADRGYSFIMRESFYTLPLDTLVKRLGNLFKTDINLGSYDEDVYQGLQAFNLSKGSALILSYTRNPDYFALRTSLEEQQNAVLMGLGGSRGIWLAVNGFSGWEQPDGTYLISVVNPLTGTMTTLAMRDNLGINEVNFNGSWQPIAIAISINAYNWNVTRTLLGTDNNGGNGWSLMWTPAGLTNATQHFFRAVGTDAGQLSGNSTILLNYDCETFYVDGDYDNSGVVDLADLTYLANYLIYGGPVPYGGEWRADANCDNYVNITDLVYFVNYLFAGAPSPCH